MGRWTRFWRLEAHERRFLVAALWMLPLTRLALSLFGFRRWQSFLKRLVPHSSQPSPAGTATERGALAVRMVRAAARDGLGHPNCLSRSLVLWWLLARQGLAAELRIGARKNGDALEAHAWVELNGVVLGEEDDPHAHYAAFDGPVVAPPRNFHTQQP